MQYRTLPHGGEALSILGIGASAIQQANEREMEETLLLAVRQGINFFDMAAADAKPFPIYGRVLSPYRRQVNYQIHFGANYAAGTYGWTTDLDTIKRSIDWQLAALRTDFIDFGFIHCLDESSDLARVRRSGVTE